MAKILVEGWRFLPHSFATINQFQCLELLKRPHLELFHRDVPYWNNSWNPVYGLLDRAREEALRAIPAPPERGVFDVTLRTGCPFDFSPGNSARTVTFATCEFGVLSSDVVARASGHGLPVKAGIRVITPSNWSKAGLARSGIDTTSITVVPHGFDPGIFSPPVPAERAALRKKFGWEDYFIFLNVSAMTSNKGIPDLLASLHEISAQHPGARLALKGLDSLYTSASAVNRYLEPLPQHIQNDLKSRVAYTGKDNTFREIAELYKAADAYVSPYLGEGFNLPVLEALACGLPVICTAGGPTDDFTTKECALRIKSRLQIAGDSDKPDMIYLQPDQPHLTRLMREVMTDDEWRSRARRIGPEFARACFTWKQVVDRLEAVLLG
jgi:glycosyltransferase involved in cell wall biosynthesis